MKGRSERFLIAAILAIFSYEWIISGLNKWFSGSFISELHMEMMDNLKNIQVPFYRDFLATYGLAHCTIIAVIVETAELFVGISFAILSYQAFRGRFGNRMLKVGVVACAVAVFMNVNFLLYQSGAVFFSIDDPFDEGVSLDFIMTLVECGMSLFFWNMVNSEAKQVLLPGQLEVQKKAKLVGR